jgi:Ig-like domain from next to BRCA1 gene
MKTLPKLLPLICMALILSACGGGMDVTPTEGTSMLDVYTAVAMTLAAQDSVATPTITLSPSTTPTLWSNPTFIASTPTSQSVSSYSSSSYSTAYGCYNAVYVSDVTIPDGTVLAPGEAFVKTWKFQNTGSCDWGEDFWITFSSGEEMDGDDTEIDEAIDAGDKAEISVALIAPDDEGTYTGYWQLSTEDGTVFGERVYVLVVVSDDASTSTATATTTSTVTATPVTISTATATPTTVPTSTNTLMPTATDTPVATSTFTPVPTEGATDEPGAGPEEITASR